MARADTHTAAAMRVASFLDDIGEHKYANDVRAVCRSLSTARFHAPHMLVMDRKASFPGFNQ